MFVVMKIFLSNDDGSGSEELLATGNHRALSEFLRRGAATGDFDSDQKARLLEVAGRHDGLALAEQKRRKIEKSRAGERVWGEPCVLLQVSDSLYAMEFHVGDEITLDGLDSATDHKYAASQMALQRAKKEGSAIGVLFKNPYTEHRTNSEEAAARAKAEAASLNAAYEIAADGSAKEILASKCVRANDKADRAEENAAEYLSKYEEAESAVVKFCRLSDLPLVMEKFPEALTRHAQKYENKV